MKNINKIIILLVTVLNLGSCKTKDLPINDTKSDDLSFLFSNKKADARIRFSADYYSFSHLSQFSISQSVGNIDFNSNSDWKNSTKGYYLINGQRIYNDNNQVVRDFFTPSELKIEFVGDTLGLESIQPTTLEGVVPFTSFTTDKGVLKKDENLVLTWNSSGDKDMKVVIQLYSNEMGVPKDLASTSKWNKIVADNGSFTIPAEVFSSMSAKGLYALNIYRANNFVQEVKKVNEVLFVARGVSSFKKMY